MPKYTYHIECFDHDNWIRLFGEVGRDYGLGYIAAIESGPMPRLAYRLVRSDGHVVKLMNACKEVDIGMAAGWPTWQQYAWAAYRALSRAEDTAVMGIKRDESLTKVAVCMASFASDLRERLEGEDKLE